MSQHRHKPPKSFANMGNPAARLRKYAMAIKDQAALDVVLAAAEASGVSEAIRAAWLESARPYLRFTPLQFQAVPSPISDPALTPNETNHLREVMESV